MARSSAHSASVLHDIHQRQRADGPAAMLGIGTANPTNCVLQDQFADWFFRVTKSEHLAELKAKTKKICDKSGITKRYFYHTEEIISGHPELIDGALPSLTTRLGIIEDAAPKLAAEAATKGDRGLGPAGGRHHAPRGGHQLRRQRTWRRPAPLRGCWASARPCAAPCCTSTAAPPVSSRSASPRTSLRTTAAPACSWPVLRPNSCCSAPPDESRLDVVIAMTLFSDGAGAVIVGADPASSPMAMERPIFHMVPTLVQGSINKCLADTLAPLGLLNASDGGWNGLFWALHPGGRAILDSYEAALGLEPGKLAASRHVLSEYGNMMGATIIFVLDEIRRRRRRCHDDRKDCQWGVMSGLGPGLTIETIVLHVTDSQDEN
ncbi:unnamed protein product [Miscanthus lutarioriparius]|uniref:Chalcone synthase n=1 Tax=Miscanthus lutarioriparius TaxID=422564 RepID=A0A811QCJ9_9POAL|nr:unnamed protein product [Miscanthus lutarioriparius]